MIEVKNLTKRYGNHLAVSDLSFEIGEGEIYGFLGPNGAGKSTTMNIMTGCLAATSGEVKIGGFDIFEDADKAKRLIGYLPELPPLYIDRTPWEYLTFVGRAKGLKGQELHDQIMNVCEVTKILDVVHRLIKNLSKGYRQRVGIAQALLGDPKVIILDEPTVGLDPRQIIEIRDLIRSLGETHTVILSSHILSEVQAICTRIMIISDGKLVACDTPENLERLFAGNVTIDLTVEAAQSDVAAILEGLPVESAEYAEPSEEGRCSVTLSAASDAADELCRGIFYACAKADKPILQLATNRATLESIFIELTGAGSDDPDYIPPEQRLDEAEPENAEQTEERSEEKEAAEE
ncbi:MAG: ABC transporter ATP-binding protein [Oscillospiraceae bacterium]|nr:ABC transporter ATP-binding protein [Oscillospiraceae bacterium]